jgi:hypothetical protein
MRKTAIAMALSVCLAISLFAADSADQSPSAGAAAPQKQKLGAWWEANAMKIKPLPTRWLFHAEGTLSYMNAAGNASGSTLDATASGEIRKGRFTSHSLVQLNRKDLTYGVNLGSVNYVERTLRQQVDFDPADYITFFAAIEGYRNTLMFLDKRVLLYAGLGGRVFRNDKTEVVVNGALGHASFTFDRAQMLLVSPEQVGVIDTSPSSGGAIAMQSWRWKVSPRLTFSENASYMKYFESRLGNRWTVNLTGNTPINKWLSFNVTYRLTEENNVILKALQVFPRDRTFLIGIKASI